MTMRVNYASERGWGRPAQGRGYLLVSIISNGVCITNIINNSNDNNAAGLMDNTFETGCSRGHNGKDKRLSTAF